MFGTRNGLFISQRLLGKGFGYRSCDRLIALIDHDNIASQKVALKAGLTYEKNVQRSGENLRVYAVNRQ